MSVTSIKLVDGTREMVLRPRDDLRVMGLEAPMPEIRAVSELRVNTDGERDTTEFFASRACSLTLRLLRNPASIVDELKMFTRPNCRPYLVVDDTDWGESRRLPLRIDQFSDPIGVELPPDMREVQVSWRVPDGVWEALADITRAIGASVPSSTGLVVTAAEGLVVTSGAETAVSFADSASSDEDPSSTSVTLDVPVSVTDGQLMVAAIKRTNDGAPTAVPGGWNLIADTNIGAGWMGMYWRIAASEPASYTWQFDLFARARGDILLYDGHDPTNPIAEHIESADGDNLTVYSSETLVTSEDRAWLIAAIGARVAAPSALTWDIDEPNDAKRTDAVTANSSNFAASLAVFDSNRGLAPDSYNRTFTGTEECTHAHMHLVSIRRNTVGSGGILIPASTDAGAGTIILDSAVDVHWVARLYGPATAPRLTLDSTGETLDFTTVVDEQQLTIAAGEYLEINSRDRTAFYLGQSSASRLGFLDFAVSTWWRLRAGEDNRVRYHPESNTGASTEALLMWREQWL